MARGRYKRRSANQRSKYIDSKQLHAICGRMLLAQAQGDLSDSQIRFFEAIVLELEHRRSVAHWTVRCNCRLCRPAEPMGVTQRTAEPGAVEP